MNVIRKIKGLGLILLLITGPAVAQSTNPLDAARVQDWQTVQSLNTEDMDINAAQTDGTTALAWAVYWDNLDTVKFLIDAGADVNAGNYIGVTPLILAAKNRSPDMVRLLLEGGADPNTAMWSGETPLMSAAKTGVTEVVTLLLDHGANINTQEPRRGQSALMWAISFGHPQTARVMIERGADISARTKKFTGSKNYTPMLMEGYGGNVEGVPQGGYTPLMFAAKIGDMETARLLLNRGADINAVSVEDGSALIIASLEGYERMALFLLDQGANPNVQDASGMSALHYAMRDGLKRLMGYVDISSARVCGFAWDTLCKYMEALTDEENAQLDNPSAGLYIVEGESDSNEYERQNRMVLPGGNMYELAESLLARGADVDAAMKYPPPRVRLDTGTWLNLAGATPIFLATAARDDAAMNILLEHGANPLVTTRVNEDVFMDQTQIIADDNQVFGNGSTLMVAVGMGKKDPLTPDEESKAFAIASRLIELGADVNETTATGWTPIHAAANIGAATLVDLLVKNGAEFNVENGCGRTPLSLAEAENSIGLIRRFPANDRTVNLLLKLGAEKSSTSGPVGVCVLGRYAR